MPAERFDRSLAVVTGGASGIGRSIATALAAEGANVVVADVDMDGARRVAAAIDGVAAKVDVRDRASVAELFRVLPSAVDVLVTAAGGASRCGAMEIDDAVLLEALQLNACGFLRCAQEASRRVIAAGRSASIVHIASSLYLGPAPELAHYAAAKAASVTLVRCLAQELSAKSIRVNAVVPGPIETPTTTAVWDARPGMREAIAGRLPLGRIGLPGDVSGGVLWLASADAAWVTGSVISIDGGLGVAP